jgi:hypothetical protein
MYFGFFSSNCFSTTPYDVSYATACSVDGLFTRKSAPKVVANKAFEISAPGGALTTADEKNAVFHPDYPAGRCMFEIAITISGFTVTIE